MVLGLNPVQNGEDGARRLPLARAIRCSGIAMMGRRRPRASARGRAQAGVEIGDGVADSLADFGGGFLGEADHDQAVGFEIGMIEKSVTTSFTISVVLSGSRTASMMRFGTPAGGTG